ncbi:hypothetical protein FHS14_002344 [Paenibacillus baekrokdamisoli]|nr:hypothetical protein [Paenibacillus baekrokdamisoli]
MSLSRTIENTEPLHRWNVLPIAVEPGFLILSPDKGEIRSQRRTLTLLQNHPSAPLTCYIFSSTYLAIASQEGTSIHIWGALKFGQKSICKVYGKIKVTKNRGSKL